MIATGHTSIGVLVGLAAAHTLPPDTPIALSFIITGLTGLASHYLMDLIPHGHYNFEAAHPTASEKILLLADVLLPIFTFLALPLILHQPSTTWWLLLAGIGGAQSPDIFDTLLRTGKIPQKIVNHPWVKKETTFHANTHWHNPTNPTQGTNQGGLPLALPRDLWQVATTILATIAIIHFY